MAKIKNRKRMDADSVNKKKILTNKKVLNPFEVHINKEKMRVLGRKLKNEKGLPGVSRAKALKKRKNTLLKEYNLLDKSNKFIDRRIGERNYSLTEEDKAMARFTAERVRNYKKQSIFNLADDEVLTHKGQSLTEIEKFEDPRSDDEEDDQNVSGKLDKNFIEDLHFGGGILKKSGVEGAKSHKDLIDQLIAESKKRKVERQKQKEANVELTEKLDAEWKDLIPLVNESKKKIEEKEEADDYDKAVKELKFEIRGTPSDRLKTEDELAKEEKEKLEKLEQERLMRMKGITESKKITHRSADDLEDNFAIDSDPEITLTYNEKGETNVNLQLHINNKENSVDSNDSNSEEEFDNEEGENKNVDSEEVEIRKNISDEEHNGEKSDENVESELEEESDTDEDNLSDLKQESSTEDESEQEVIQKEDKISKKVFETNKNVNELQLNSKKDKNVDDIQRNVKESNCSERLKDLLERKEIMEAAQQELPYTFKLPDSYEDLEKIFENYGPTHQGVIIERMIKCNHPSLSEGNKEKLALLFIYLIQYLNDVSTYLTTEDEVKKCFKILSNLTPQLYDLAQLNQEKIFNSMVDLIKEKQNDYRKNKKRYPDLDVLLFLKLVSVLFPTSDFRHQIVTPCFIYIEEMLNLCKVRTKREISYGLFLVNLILEYTSLSKRYLPVSINFLCGILHMAIPKTGVLLLKVLPPFKPTANLLVLLNNCNSKEFIAKLSPGDLLDDEICDDYKITCFYITLKLLNEFKEILKYLPSFNEIFEPVLEKLTMLPFDNYPLKVQTVFKNLVDDLRSLKKEFKIEYIVMEKKRPKALRLYEPRIEKVYDMKKHKVQSKEKAERDKLLYKLKQEKKGALREIRRDASFLGKIKIKAHIESDRERKEKVKRIYAEANLQQSELNALDRKKKRKK